MVSILIASALWFYADFDRPFLIDGLLYDRPMKCGEHTEGRFGRGYAFVSDAKRCENDFLVIDDPDLLAGFPWGEGSFSCFYRLPEGAAPKSVAPLWGFGGFWQNTWTWSGTCFSTEDARKKSGRLMLDAKDFAPTNGWRHFCATWNADELVCYFDGRRVASRPHPTRVDLRNVPRAVFRLGCCGDGSPAANLVADEVAVFRGALDAEAVRALSSSRSPIVSESAFLGGHVAFPIFWRNQENAAIRMRVWCPQGDAFRAELTVAGHSFPERDIMLKTGNNRLAVPFDPGLFGPGTDDWKLTLRRTDGQPVLEQTGRLEIRGRVERDCFKFNSWGGSTGILTDELVAMGFNSRNVAAGACGRGVREELRRDIFLNYRLENSREWKKFGLDETRIARSVAQTLEPAIGLHLWAMTLVNSEVYGGGMEPATNGVLAAKCRTATGHDPDIRVRREPIEIDFRQKGIEPYRGIMPDDDPTLETIRWYWREGGFPACQMNVANGRTIHRLSPGNLVWSEPSPATAGLDLVADWIYDYKSETALQTMRRQFAHARARRVLNMPTLGMEYWHTFPPSGRHPMAKDKGGKPLSVRLAQSCDEVMIKSWMALGAVRCDALGYYAADAWLRGAEGLSAWESSPTNVFRVIGERDAAARYGRFVRERLAPAAELLRGLDPDRLPVGVIWFDETQRAGGTRWAYHHYLNQVCDALTRLPVGFDYLTEADDLKPETLGRYRYLVLPMLSVVTKSHDALLRNLPSSVRLVTDAHAGVTYPNGTCLMDMKYRTENGVLEFNRKGVDEPLTAFFGDKTDALRRELGAWSDGDGTTSYTFVKRLDGVAYVTVVNNARREGGSPMNVFNTNGWYRPCGAPCRITTHFNLPGTVYKYNAGKGEVALSDRTAVADFAAAEGTVYCVYPRPLARVEIEASGRAEQGCRLTLAVRVSDSAGVAPGRQVVRLTLTDSRGCVWDESGLYRVERGAFDVPVRLARDAAVGDWTASVTELTSGLSASLTFAVNPPTKGKQP